MGVWGTALASHYVMTGTRMRAREWQVRNTRHSVRKCAVEAMVTLEGTGRLQVKGENAISRVRNGGVAGSNVCGKENKRKSLGPTARLNRVQRRAVNGSAVAVAAQCSAAQREEAAVAGGSGAVCAVWQRHDGACGSGQAARTKRGACACGTAGSAVRRGVCVARGAPCSPAVELPRPAAVRWHPPQRRRWVVRQRQHLSGGGRPLPGGGF